MMYCATKGLRGHLVLAPNLWRILSTQHNIFEWGNPECRVWILSVECGVSIRSLGPCSRHLTITRHSTLKIPDLAPCIWMGNLKWGRIHIQCSEFPNSNMWSAEYPSKFWACYHCFFKTLGQIQRKWIMHQSHVSLWVECSQETLFQVFSNLIVDLNKD